MDTFEKILSLTDEDLMKRHDQENRSTAYDGSFYIREYYRRQQDKSSQKIEIINNQMLNYTKLMTIMTFVMMLLTIVNIGMFIYSILI